MDKKQVTTRITHLLDMYCTDCFLKKYHRESYSKKVAHRFCIQECTVGQQLQNCGRRLEKSETHSKKD